jgi:hypothetical protein
MKKTIPKRAVIYLAIAFSVSLTISLAATCTYTTQVLKWSGCVDNIQVARQTISSTKEAPCPPSLTLARSCASCDTYSDWKTPDHTHIACNPTTQRCVRDSNSDGKYDQQCDSVSNTAINVINLYDYDIQNDYRCYSGPCSAT